MARARRSTDRRAGAQEPPGQAVEKSRQTARSTGRTAAEAERAMLREAIEATPRRAARLRRAAAAAGGDINVTRMAEETVP